MSLEQVTLKILSYNIHKGFNVGNKQFLLEEIRAAIRLVDADLVFLQEVCGFLPSNPESSVSCLSAESQFEYLADSIWDHHAYGKNAIYQNGDHGNALLSKFPFVCWENIDISTNKYSRRGLLHGVIQINFEKNNKSQTGKLHVLCVHMGLFEGERKSQIKKMCERILEHIPEDEPLILAGDFNDWSASSDRAITQYLNLTEGYKNIHGSLAKTFPSWAPMIKLDRVYVRGVEVQSAEALKGSPWNSLSDHVPLYLELKFIN
jgi:endonuclease/exonuclease/phosphatase family metal-dependent hydrolase